jgi:hypothetical protein
MEIKQRLLIILIIALLFPSGCGGEKPESKNFNVDNFEILSAKGYWDEAVLQAENWQEEAYLTHVSIDIPLPNANRGVRAAVGFHFLTSDSDTLKLTVSCSGVNCSERETEHDPEFPLQQTKNISKNEFSLTSKEAFEIGVKKGGVEYIYNDNVISSLVLMRDLNDYSGPVIWVVKFLQFRDGDFPEKFRVEIDANTGEVLETNQ